MDPVRNPFAPGAGNPPPELAGRKTVLDEVSVSLQRIALARPAQGSILVGLRGVGKTVLLVRIGEIARSHRFKVIKCEAHEGKGLVELLVPGLRSTLFSLSTMENAKDKSKRALRVFKSFMNGLKFKFNEVEIGLSIEAEAGAADSGDLETDLPQLLYAVGEAARDAAVSICILVDELQYLSNIEFSAIIMSMHHISQNNLPIIFIAAGLPQILGLAGESKSYSERLFKYPKIGTLTKSEAELALTKPLQEEKVVIQQLALDYILEKTERYPYFIQQWGHDAWNIADGNIITLSDAQAATPVSLKALDESFFQVRFDRCNPSEKRYMRALAELGAGSHKSSEVASLLGSTTTKAGFTRNSLIKKGMIFSPQYGDTEFTVPMFDEYMRRAIKRFE